MNIHLNNESAWTNGYQPKSAPLSKEEIERRQSDINSIIGVTRDSQPILKLVWNGDVEFWEAVYIAWDNTGVPTKEVKRPLVLYKSEWSEDKTKLVRDYFVPRWLLLQRSEPETYMKHWEQFSYMVSPNVTELKMTIGKDGIIRAAQESKKILFRPPVPPKNGWYRWFMTICDHDGTCCGHAAQFGANCFGSYAPPEAAYPHLRQIAESRRHIKDTPFLAPEEVHARMASKGNNNYERQGIKAYESTRSSLTT